MLLRHLPAAGRAAAAMLLAALMLAACAGSPLPAEPAPATPTAGSTAGPAPTQDTDPAPPGKGSDPVPSDQSEEADQRLAPAVTNLTQMFPNVTLAAVDGFGEYTSLVLKITYRITPQGELEVLPKAEQEPVIDESITPADRMRCTAVGGAFNQFTTWFPDAAILVGGGSLLGLTDGQGTRRPLLKLIRTTEGLLIAAGPGTRDPEYAYAPCVGTQRVALGHRTEMYLNPGDRIRVRASGKGRSALTIRLPADPRPFVMFTFKGRNQRALAPANLVLLTLDLARGRAVAQYQLTIAMQPRVALAEWAVTVPAEALEGLPASARARQEAVRRYLDTCAPPLKPMDPCTNPHGVLPRELGRTAIDT